MKTINIKTLLPRYTGAIELILKGDKKTVSDARDNEVLEDIDEVLDDALKQIESIILTGTEKE